MTRLSKTPLNSRGASSESQVHALNVAGQLSVFRWIPGIAEQLL